MPSVKSISISFAFAIIAIVVSLDVPSTASAETPPLSCSASAVDCNACLNLDVPESSNRRKSDCSWFTDADGDDQSCVPAEDCDDTGGGDCVRGKSDDPRANEKRCSRSPDVCGSNFGCKPCLKSKRGRDCAYWKVPGVYDGKARRCVPVNSCGDDDRDGGLCNLPVVEEIPSTGKRCRKIDDDKQEPAFGMCHPGTVGDPLDEVVRLIETAYSDDADVVPVRPGDDCCTEDLVKNRIRVFVDEDDVVTAEPCFG